MRVRAKVRVRGCLHEGAHVVEARGAHRVLGAIGLLREGEALLGHLQRLGVLLGRGELPHAHAQPLDLEPLQLELLG